MAAPSGPPTPENPRPSPAGAGSNEAETEALERAAALRAAMLDALPAPVALLDPWGVIAAGNAPWRRLVAGAGCPHEWAGVGSPYAAVLQSLRADPAADLSPVWRALQDLETPEPHSPAPGGGDAGRPHPAVDFRAPGGRHPHLIVFTRVSPEGGGGFLATHIPLAGWGNPGAGREPPPAASAPPAPPSIRAILAEVPSPPQPPVRRSGPIRHPAPERPPAAPTGLALAASRYRAVFEAADLGLLVVEPDGTILAANPAATQLFGYSSHELEGRPLLSLGREAPGVLERAWDPVNRNGRARGVHRFRASGGRDRFLEWSARAGVVEGRHLVTLRLPDESGGNDDPLRQARKLEALGQVTGGIAHEINNVLTVILAGIDIVMEEQEPSAEVREELARVRRAAGQGAETVRRLLTFSRRKGENRRPVDLGEVVRGMEDLLDRVLPGRITLRIDIRDPAPLAVAGPGDVEEILLNLVSNARDSMTNGGTLEIRLRRVRLGGSEAEPLGLPGEGEYLALTVRDSGSGMPPAVLERAFEPFFTTKGVHGGTGLGLSLVYGIMREHGGAVGIRSAPGAGTSVTLWFPAVAVPGRAPPEGRATPSVQPGGGEVILLVEDDDAIRSATSRILKRFGYQVVTASDGDEAMDLLNDVTADLVISDVVMPRAGGIAVYQAARTLDVPPRFLFMSGYAASDISGLKELPTDVPLLSKPWSAAELLDAVRRALGGPRPSAG